MNPLHRVSNDFTSGPISRRSALRFGATAAALVGFGGAAAGRAHAAPSTNGSVVYASDFGFNPTDSTSALQQALDSSASTVVIDNVGVEWLTRPLTLNRDNVCVTFQPGVTVRAKPGGFPNVGDTVLKLHGRANVTLSGYGASIAMNKQEYIDLHDGGEWRMALAIDSCSDVTIEGLTLSGAGGDGIYLGRVQGAGYAAECRNITIRDVCCDDNYRNGISVVSVDGLLIEGSSFINTSGHNPQAGIDFEPNLADEQLSNIVVRNCVFDNNVNYNVVVSCHGLAGASTPMSILFDRIRLGVELNDWPSFLLMATPTGDPGGTIEVRDSLLANSPYAGAVGAWSKSASGVALNFTRTVFSDWGNQFGRYQPLSISAQTVADYGGMHWTDCLLITDQDTPFFMARAEDAPGAGLRDLHGNITVVDPHGATMYLGGNPTDVSVDVRELTAVPDATVSIEACRSAIRRGSPITLLVSRDSADLQAPLAVRYSLSGAAVERYDFAGTPGMAMIPPGASSVRVSLPTRRLSPPSTGSVAATFTIDPDVAYSVSASATATVTITD
jgi:hypothetical protein